MAAPYGNNPYGTLGPSPGRVTRINRLRAAPTKKKPRSSGSFLANIPTVLSDEQARDRAMALLAPLFQQQNDRINRGYDQRSGAIKEAYEALAKYGQGVGPAIQGAYEGAARDTAAFGKGFSDAIQQLSQGQADTASAGIAAQGGPQTVSSGFTGGGGDALYAMGGQIPASALSREGAAFTSAASFLPSTAAGMGVDALRSMEAERSNELLDLEAERPGTILDLMNQVVDRSDARRKDALGLALEQRDYRDKQAQTKQERVDRQYEAAALKLAYGMKLSPREKRLLSTYGMTPEAVQAAGRAYEERADDARSAAAARADDQRSMALQNARDKAAAARQEASDARRAMLEARKAAARSGLEADKARYRTQLEKFKAAERRKLQAQRDAAALARKKSAPGKGKAKKSGAANSPDSYFKGK